MTISRRGTLPNVEAFCQTFATGSFTRAARALGVTPQATSRAVARLERALGVALFRRTTRQLAPTEAARRYHARCEQALHLLALAEDDAAAGRDAPAGEVRLSVPTTYGHHRLLPGLAALRDRYPAIRLALHVDNHNADFVADGVDLAIRLGAIADHGLVARRLGDFPLGVFAAPAYLARFGAPRTPAELAAHHCIAFVRPSTGRALAWTFAPAPQRWDPDAAYRCAGDPLATIALARAGLGLVQTYDFLVERELAHGELVEVLAAYRGASRPFSLVYPRAARQGRAVRAVIEHVLASARATPARRSG